MTICQSLPIECQRTQELHRERKEKSRKHGAEIRAIPKAYLPT